MIGGGEEQEDKLNKFYRKRETENIYTQKLIKHADKRSKNGNGTVTKPLPHQLSFKSFYLSLSPLQHVHMYAI